MLDIYYHPLPLFIWGCCWGSFLNVIFYRYPLGKSIIYPGSACPGCNKSIAFYDNIPVLSWLFLLGRCRRCKKGISPKYPAVETFYGIVSSSGYWLYPNHWLLGICISCFLLAFLPLLVLLVKHKRAPWYLWLLSLVGLTCYLVQLSRI